MGDVVFGIQPIGKAELWNLDSCSNKHLHDSAKNSFCYCHFFTSSQLTNNHNAR